MSMHDNLPIGQSTKVSERVFGLVLAASLGSALLFAPPVYAAVEGSWSSDWPWWCNHNNEVCMKYSSETTYVGPTYTDCSAILETGWSQQVTVDIGCAGNN